MPYSGDHGSGQMFSWPYSYTSPLGNLDCQGAQEMGMFFNSLLSSSSLQLVLKLMGVTQGKILGPNQH